MSSHHFVKEGQEPSLFIIDATSLSDISPLLEWAPVVMVLDKALDTVLSWGIKIDAVLTRLDHLMTVEEKTSEQFPLQIFSYRPEEEPVLIGLQTLAKDQKAVHVVSDSSDYIFELLQNYVGQLNLVLLDGKMRWIPVSKKFEKWLPSKAHLVIRKKTDQQIAYEGLTQIDQNTFESIADGNIKIKSSENFWIGETTE